MRGMSEKGGGTARQIAGAKSDPTGSVNFHHPVAVNAAVIGGGTLSYGTGGVCVEARGRFGPTYPQNAVDN